MVVRHLTFALTFSLFAVSVTAIVGGTNITDPKYSFAAVILEPEDGDDSRECTSFLCDAIVVSPTTAITAAECLYGVDPRDLVLRVGLTPVTQKNMTITAITNMPTFNSTTLQDDLCVLQLSSPVPTDISIAQLPAPGMNLSSNLQILGWGPSMTGIQALSPFLQAANSTVLCEDDCAHKLSSCFQLDKSELICTSSDTHGEISYGDAGGPVIDEDDAVVALITGSPACAQPDGIGIKLRLDGEAVQAFIRNHTCEVGTKAKAGGKEEDGMGYISNFD